MSAPAAGTAVISGAGSGLGRAIALELARTGHRLGLIGRRPEPLEEVLRESGAEGLCATADVRDAAAVKRVLAAISERLGPATVAVPAAGIARVAPFVDLDDDALRESVETNLLGAAHLYRATLPAMLERGSGALVALLSVAARTVFPGWSAYSASKWGLLGLVESLREELRGSGVRVVAITPGATDTELWNEVPGVWETSRMIPAAEVARALSWALAAGDGVTVEEIRLQPPGGNL